MCDDAVRVAEEVDEEVEFLFREGDGASVVEDDGSGGRVDRSAGEGGDGWHFGAFGRAAEDGCDAGHEFEDAEGFDDIIVRSELQSFDAVGFFASGGEHDGGDARAFFFHDGQYFEAVGLGHVDVEQGEVDMLGEEDFEGLAAVARFMDGVAGSGEGVGQSLTDGCVVFRDEDAAVIHAFRIARMGCFSSKSSATRV